MPNMAFWPDRTLMALSRSPMRSRAAPILVSRQAGAAVQVADGGEPTDAAAQFDARGGLRRPVARSCTAAPVTAAETSTAANPEVICVMAVLLHLKVSKRG